jgi:predicted DNA-binding antitoxin AbrB/MazE fold protein
MPLPPLDVQLTNGQQIEVLKRFRERYADELEKTESEMKDILLARAEAEFISKYLGDQPEVVELRQRCKELDAKEKRRQYLGMIIDRLDAVLPKQVPVTVPAPVVAAPSGSSKSAGVRRY